MKRQFPLEISMPECPTTVSQFSPSGYVCKVVRESFPRQVDKKSRGPQGERHLEFSRRKKGQTFFPSTFLGII